MLQKWSEGGALCSEQAWSAGVGSAALQGVHRGGQLPADTQAGSWNHQQPLGSPAGQTLIFVLNYILTMIPRGKSTKTTTDSGTLLLQGLILSLESSVSTMTTARQPRAVTSSNLAGR